MTFAIATVGGLKVVQAISLFDGMEIRVIRVLVDLNQFSFQGGWLFSNLAGFLVCSGLHAEEVLLGDQHLMHGVFGTQYRLLGLDCLLTWLWAYHELVQGWLESAFQIVDGLG